MDNNPWQYVKIDPKSVETNPYLNPRAPNPEPAPEPAPQPAPPASSSFTGQYILMPQKDTYALGVHTLQEACVQENNQNQEQIILPNRKKVYRPLTFLENILARMHDFETLHDSNGNQRTLEDRKRYFDTWLDSSCGIAYRADSTKLKLQLVCPKLISIAKDSNTNFLSINYASFIGQELDSSSKNFVRDGWMTLLEGKTDVYANYLKMLKTITGRDITPNFLARSKDNLKTDELRAVWVSSLGGNSNANGNGDLNNFARFLRRSP